VVGSGIIVVADRCTILAHRAECEHVTHPAEAGINEPGFAGAQKMRCAPRFTG